jgi:hypothetical protein
MPYFSKYFRFDGFFERRNRRRLSQVQIITCHCGAVVVFCVDSNFILLQSHFSLNAAVYIHVNAIRYLFLYIPIDSIRK